MNSYKLKDLLSIKNGKDHKELNDGNIPVFGSGGIMRYGDQAIFEDESILLPRKGTLSNIQYVNEPFWTVDTIYYSVVNKKLANPFYLFNYLKSLDLSNLNSGTGVPSMTFNSYYDLHVKLPDLPIQKSIAKVLSDLDAKIELNNRINRELEAMAKTLYDYWFVQFDFPNKQGKPYKSSGGKMVYNVELKREIPEGWEVKNIFQCSKVQYGFPFSTENFNTEGTGFPVIRIRDILENSISNFSFEQNIDEKYLIKKGDILVGMDGNFHINYWAKDGCFLNQRAVKLSETILPNIYLKYQIEPFIKLREKSVSRTTVGHLSDKDLRSSSIIIPSKEVLSSISSIYNDLLKRMIQTINENQQLTELRDWLLPMLMNGQVTVKEAEERLSMAAEPSVEYKKV
ncbi:MAG: restriction endonuclease subunit S [Sphingobacteriia bacterium]|nr:restriction endonuclease subunit S [Sphingobacteriia bacterium]